MRVFHMLNIAFAHAGKITHALFFEVVLPRCGEVVNVVQIANAFMRQSAAGKVSAHALHEVCGADVQAHTEQPAQRATRNPRLCC